MAGNGKVEEEKEELKKGGLRTMPFVLASELCDRFALAGFNANMVQYLQNELHLHLVQATNTLNFFGGTASLTPIVGGLIADSFAGRFMTIAAGSFIYLLGMIGVTVSAILPGLRPPPCELKSETCQGATTCQLLVFYGSLLLTAAGSGGIRPCVVAFGADQFELDRQKAQHGGRRSFFNLYFFSMGFSTLLALTVAVYVQDNVGWGLGFGIPSVAMFVSIVAFVAGYPLYIRRKPGGSPLIRLAQVVVAAVRKRKIQLPGDANLLYQNKEIDLDISTAGRLLHTDHFTSAKSLAAVDGPRVEELKSILRILPLWSVGIFLITAASHNHTFAIIQAKSMDRHLFGSFQIPAATLTIFSVLAMLLTIVIYDRVLVPLARRLTGLDSGITYLQRMGLGLAISLSSNISASIVEYRRRRAASMITGRLGATVPMSVFWLVPQYAVHGIGDGFYSVGHMGSFMTNRRRA
ncbi:hypothetical protein HPP92_027796 [Vanilla planifolia]|uniref:Uncharacterized protein n=1 Tax=Vanilla planifolia TaxID=51239 RepID=A0A835U4Y1_VANPL|nr:hypothetical protein HPP92_027796 [Vanilla planifolia]